MASIEKAAGMLLRVLRIKSRLGQEKMARLLGVTQPTISRWERGAGKPSHEHLEAWLDACGVAGGRGSGKGAGQGNPIRRVLNQYYDSGAPEEVASSGRLVEQALASVVSCSQMVYDTRVPYYADVAAGLGEAQEQRAEPRGHIAVPKDILDKDPLCYALRVVGDSMSPHIFDGDLVVVSPAAPLVDGCIVAAFLEPDGDIVKYYRKLPDGRVLLQPANPGFPTVILGPEPGRSARIWGRIVLQQRDL